MTRTARVSGSIITSTITIMVIIATGTAIIMPITAMTKQARG
jgi:hypothetical protein